MGKTRIRASSEISCCNILSEPVSSITGLVLGMAQIVVNPPAAAASDPVLIVSLCSNPGLRK